MKNTPANRSAFTLIELLAVIVIISVLATMATPGLQRAIDKSRSIVCGANLRSIGAAVQLYLGDNDNDFPTIEPHPSHPDYPADQGASGMLDVLGPYGVEAKTLQCPVDLHGNNYFAQEGSSYMWCPMADAESANAVVIYGRTRNDSTRTHLLKRLSLLRLCSDFPGVSNIRPHSGTVNTLYADGHVSVH